MRMLIVGAGATGGYFGGRLVQAGRDVTFLVRPARAAQLRASGLVIVSPSHGDATLQPRVVTADALDGPYDAVLLTVKEFGLDGALADMAPAIGPETLILPVLNGMRHMDVIAARFSPRNVGGCACKVATMLGPSGAIRQLSPLQDLAYGELDGQRTPRIEALDAAMQGAGFFARLSPNILQEMWEKWVLLASLGGMTCLLRGHVGEINAAPGGTAIAQAVLAECVAAAAAEGHVPRDAFVATTRAQYADPGSQAASSMYRDLQRNLPLEFEPILGDLVARAAKHGVQMPLLGAAYAQLAIAESRRRAA